jgi:hypothetical protein
MTQFYARATDEKRCRDSLKCGHAVVITGLTAEGQFRVFAATVQSVEVGQTAYPGYPLRITMSDSN